MCGAHLWELVDILWPHSCCGVATVSQLATPQQLTRHCQSNDEDPSGYFHCIKTTYYTHLISLRDPLVEMQQGFINRSMANKLRLLSYFWIIVDRALHNKATQLINYCLWDPSNHRAAFSLPYPHLLSILCGIPLCFSWPSAVSLSLPRFREVHGNLKFTS